jgi:high-affinity nickel-transport protein
MILAVDAGTGLQIGLMATAAGLGFRHGIDWDHIAALTDLTGSQASRRRSMALATLYALGHALVVFVLGVLAITAIARVPSWLDDGMSRIVGVTLVALGAYMLYALARHGRDFRMRSRWMLVFAAIRRTTRALTRHDDVVVITHAHEHSHDGPHDHDHEHADTLELVGEGASTAVLTSHRHVHRHIGRFPEDPFTTTAPRTAFAVGMLHGVGAETPTQILLFLAASRAGGIAAGILLLACFLAGLLASNTVVALTATFGILGASRHFPLYATVSVVAATFSLVIGTLFILGQTPLLPAISGG